MLDLFNTFAAGMLATVSAWAVMSPRVRCGLIAHIGLVMISVGFFGVFLMGFETYIYAAAMAAAQAFVHVGLVLCAIGYAQRTRRRGQQRRVSDWVERRG
jgi:hypothetical protein